MKAMEGLVPNLDHEPIKNKNENTTHVKQKIQQDFIAKNK